MKTKYAAAILVPTAVLLLASLGWLLTTTEAEAKHPPNRLAGETSLYLLMHAHNPVQWYPWGEEAFAKAKEENKLIFLSIGYSSCYYCHRMERESFMDEEIAAFLNKHFVCIKVDREERPDIDAIYMTALQAMTGRGGWPLSIFLTPEAKPIIGGTYYPPRTREITTDEGETARQVGFLDVIQSVQQGWEEQEQAMRGQADRVASHLKQLMRTRPVILGNLDQGKVDSVLSELSENFDPQHGGFGFSESQPQRPKFPEPSNLMFLLGRLQRDPDDTRARTMLLTTLEKMALGGIRDHLAGGFHRYSTDRFWRIPHFEKMLYDNGQLATVYAEAYRLTGNKLHARVAREICEFVLHEMQAESGGFYSAIDAETDEEEGKFYVWTLEEIEQLLSEEERVVLMAAYGIGEQPNFEDQHVLVMHQPLAATAKQLEIPEDELAAKLAPMREKLLAHRNKRTRPLTDKKILTAWNGLMIRGLADCGRILEREKYVEAAAEAADFILEKLVTDEGRLMRTHTGEQAKLNGYLDDYAFFARGLIALHQATGEKRWLDAADRLTAKQIELFWDDRAGGFYFTSHDHEELIVRSKDPTDGAIPAGNSVAADNLLYLAEALDKPAYRERAEGTLRSAIPLLERAPSSVPRLAAALVEYLENAN